MKEDYVVVDVSDCCLCVVELCTCVSSPFLRKSPLLWKRQKKFTSPISNDLQSNRSVYTVKGKTLTTKTRCLSMHLLMGDLLK